MRQVGDLEGFARQQPWAVAAGALILGFAASRFLKSTSTRRYRTGGYDAASGTYGGGASGYGINAGTAYGSTGTGYGTSGTGYGATGTGSDVTDTTGIRSGGERYAT